MWGHVGAHLKPFDIIYDITHTSRGTYAQFFFGIGLANLW